MSDVDELRAERPAAKNATAPGPSAAPTPETDIRRQPGLSGKNRPVGWGGEITIEMETRARDIAGARPAPRIGKPGSPTGLNKLWRYFRTVLTMVRRPAVVTHPPIHLQMESTDACNLHCMSCSRDVIVKRAKLLDHALWRKVIDEIRPTNINVSGIGEPFLHPKIFDIIAYARKSGAAVNCATNFTRVKGRFREIVESGIGQLKVSVDAANRETFLAIRGEDAFDEIIANIKEVVRMREEAGAPGPEIRFNFAVQRLNFTQCVDLVDLAAEIGVDGIYFQYLEYVDMEDRKQMLVDDMTREALTDILRKAEARAAEKGIITNIPIWWRDFDIFWNKMQPISEFKPNHKACYFPWISSWVGADGWIRPCPIMPWTLDEGRMGHLGENSFAEIWNNPKYQALRTALAKGERPTRACKTCVPQSMYNIFYLRAKLLPGK